MIRYSSRDEQLDVLLKKVLNFNKVLYVGAQVNNKRGKARRVPTGYKALKPICKTIDCLEIFEPYKAGLLEKGWFDNIFIGDICDGLPGEYDLVFWCHGPEHVEYSKLMELLSELPKWAPNVWMACPWGVSKQGVLNDNVYEKHVSYLVPEDFENLGYEVSVSGRRNRKGSNIVAWIKQ